MVNKLERTKERENLLNQAIVDTVREPLLVMDGTLKVLNASYNFYDTFKVNRKETIGYLLFDLGNGQWNIPGLRQLLTDVLEKKTSVEDYEVVHKFPDIGEKVMLLNARKVLHDDNRPEAILLAIQDITARVEFERSKERERLLNQAIIDTVREPLLVMDGTLKVLNASYSFYETFKVNRKETIGNRLFDLGNGQWNIPGLRQLLTNVLEKKTSVEAYEVVHRFPDIGEKVMLLNARKVLHDDNRPEAILLAIQDITARVEAGRTKERERLLNQAIIDTVREPLLVMDGTLKVLNASYNFYETFKVNPKETIGNRLFDLGNGQWNIPGLRQLLTDVLEKKTSVETYEVVHKFPDIGEKVMLLNARKVLYDDNRPEAILLAIQDITTRVEAGRTKEREHLLNQAIVDTVREPLLVMDGTLKVLNASYSFYDTFKVNRKETIGNRLFDLGNGQWNIPGLRQLLTDVLEKKTSVEAYEVVHRFPDIGKKVMLLNARKVLHEDNRHEAILLAIEDVTERIESERNQLEKQFRRSQKMEAVGQLAGGIAHDFNNILGLILGNLEIVESLPPGDSKIASRIDAAGKAVERGVDITQKLLGFSRKDPHDIQLVDVRVSINNLIALLTKSLTVSIAVKSDLADDLWRVEIDPGDFEDTILNLALNARDAMPDGGTLTLKTENKTLDKEFLNHNPAATAGSFVLISIRDTGIGMTDDVKDRAFEPFFTTKEVGKGTGLGLSMVYGFIERSGGFITIDSDVGKGTDFRLYLPRGIKKAPDLKEPEIAPADLPRGREKILIVDDEEGLLDITAHNLGELGYKILMAEDGPSALKTLEQERDIDLLFSDVVMPNFMNGYELAQKAHKSHPQLKVLLNSGYDRKPDGIENSNEPFLVKLRKTQLEKPYTISELAIAIRKALDEEY